MRPDMVIEYHPVVQKQPHEVPTSLLARRRHWCSEMRWSCRPRASLGRLSRARAGGSSTGRTERSAATLTPRMIILRDIVRILPSENLMRAGVLHTIGHEPCRHLVVQGIAHDGTAAAVMVAGGCMPRHCYGLLLWVGPTHARLVRYSSNGLSVIHRLHASLVPRVTTSPRWRVRRSPSPVPCCRLCQNSIIPGSGRTVRLLRHPHPHGKDEENEERKRENGKRKRKKTACQPPGCRESARSRWWCASGVGIPDASLGMFF